MIDRATHAPQGVGLQLPRRCRRSLQMWARRLLLVVGLAGEALNSNKAMYILFIGLLLPSLLFS